MTRGDPRDEAANSLHEGAPRSLEERAPGELLRVAQRAGGAAPTTKDDSGIIDLRALMASATAESRDAPVGGAELTPIPVVRHLSMYPFGAPSESPEVDPPAPAVGPAPRGSARRLGLLLGLGVALLAGGVTALLIPRTSSDGQRAVAPLATTAPPSSVGAQAPAFQGTPESLPAPSLRPEVTSPVETLPAEAANAAPVKAAPPRSRPPVKKPQAAVKPVPVSAPAKPPPPADTCKGNLLCAMKRATAGP